MKSRSSYIVKLIDDAFERNMALGIQSQNTLSL